MRQRHRRRVPCDMGVSDPPSLQSKFQCVFIIYTVFPVVFSVVFYDCLCRRLAPTVINLVSTDDDTLPPHRPPHAHAYTTRGKSTRLRSTPIPSTMTGGDGLVGVHSDPVECLRPLVLEESTIPIPTIVPPVVTADGKTALELLRDRHAALGRPLQPYTYAQFCEILGDDKEYLDKRVAAGEPLTASIERLGYFIVHYQCSYPMVEAVTRMCGMVHANQLDWFHMHPCFTLRTEETGNDIMLRMRTFTGLAAPQSIAMPASLLKIHAETANPKKKRGRPRKQQTSPGIVKARRPRGRPRKPRPPPSSS